MSVILIVLRIPLVRLFYGAGRFDWTATRETGLTLAYFSISLTANALLYLLMRAFYAYKDSKTPLIVTAACVGINVFLAWLFVLVYHLPIYSLAFAFSISSILGVFVLAFMLNRRITLPKMEIFVTFTKIFIATLIMGVCLYVPIKLLDQLVFDTTRTLNLLVLTGIASSAGLIAYVFLTWLFDIKEAQYVIAVLKKFGNRDKILKQISEVLDRPNQNL
jgi:putative peptidoglycan lipid II flippase